MIDWSGAWIQMKADVNKIYEHLNRREIDEADELLTEVIINARLIRAYMNSTKDDNHA